MDKNNSKISVTPMVDTIRADSELTDSLSEYDRQLEACTQKLASSVTDYDFVYGRRYHGFKRGIYPFPNDEREAERIDIAHQLFFLANGKKLYQSPLVNPQHILDLGTGTGIWAIDMAEKFPDAHVIGNDLSPIQPDWVPPNLHFEVDDIEEDWLFTEPFDFIYCRALHSAIRNWPKLVHQTFKFTKPGGYVELVNYDATWRSPDNTIPPESAIGEVNRLFRICTQESGAEASPGVHQERWMREAGFEDVVVKRVPLPIGSWPADPHLKEVGRWKAFALLDHIDSFISYMFQYHLGHTREECQALAALVRRQLMDPKTHAYFDLYITYGRKPR